MITAASSANPATLGIQRAATLLMIGTPKISKKPVSELAVSFTPMERLAKNPTTSNRIPQTRLVTNRAFLRLRFMAYTQRQPQ